MKTFFRLLIMMALPILATAQEKTDSTFSTSAVSPLAGAPGETHLKAQASNPHSTNTWNRMSITGAYAPFGRFPSSNANDKDQKALGDFPATGWDVGMEYRFSENRKVMKHLGFSAAFEHNVTKGKIQLTNTLAPEDLVGLEELGADLAALQADIHPKEDLKLTSSALSTSFDVHLFPGRRFDISGGAGPQIIQITHLTVGKQPQGFDPETLRIISAPLFDKGTEWHPEAMFYGEVSFRLPHGMRVAVGYEQVIEQNKKLFFKTMMPVAALWGGVAH